MELHQGGARVSQARPPDAPLLQAGQDAPLPVPFCPEMLQVRAEAYALFGLLVLSPVCPGVPGGLPWECMAPGTRGSFPAQKEGSGTGVVTLAFTHHESRAGGPMASDRQRTNVRLGSENSHKHLLLSRAEMENFPEGSSVTTD